MKVVISLIIIILPIALYLLNIAYNNNYNKNNNYLPIILIIEIIIFILFKDNTESLILINVPLLISYLKRYELTSIIISIILVFYYVLFI